MKATLISLIVIAYLAAAASARAEPAPATYRAQSVADVSFPFWCEWGYDWDERCWWDNTTRLAVGGDADKVWRAGVRFDLSSVPPDASVLSATLRLYFDGTCVGLQGATRACAGRSYDLDVHQIYTRNWFGEREVEHGPAVSSAAVSTGAGPRWVGWNVSEIVFGWACGDENAGLLVKLADGQEAYRASGPKFASMSYADQAVRPVLEVTYLPAG